MTPESMQIDGYPKKKSIKVSDLGIEAVAAELGRHNPQEQNTLLSQGTTPTELVPSLNQLADIAIQHLHALIDVDAYSRHLESRLTGIEPIPSIYPTINWDKGLLSTLDQINKAVGTTTAEIHNTLDRLHTLAGG